MVKRLLSTEKAINAQVHIVRVFRRSLALRATDVTELKMINGRLQSSAYQKQGTEISKTEESALNSSEDGGKKKNRKKFKRGENFFGGEEEKWARFRSYVENLQPISVMIMDVALFITTYYDNRIKTKNLGWHRYI